MEAHVRLQASAPEDAEFYVAVQGSKLTHVTAAKRGDDGLTLYFTVPGMSFSQPLKIPRFLFFAGHCLTDSRHDFFCLP